MLGRLSLSLLIAISLGMLPPRALAKKTKDTPPPTTAPSKSDKDKDRDDDDDAETHKKRAKEFADGKPVDKNKTKEQLDKIKGQTNDLKKKLKDSGDLPEEEAPKKGKPKKKPDPAPEETPKAKKDKDKDKDKDKSDN